MLRATALTSGVMLSLAMAACGTSTTSVASLPPVVHGTAPTTSTPSTSQTSSTPQTPGVENAARPRYRLDDTQARRDALINAWSSCLLAHGAKKSTSPRYAGSSGGLIHVADPVPASAKAACVGKLPLMPPQLEAATNPHFHVDSLAYVACMQKKGLYVTLLNSNDIDWTFTPGHSVPANENQIEHSCELSAFGGGSHGH